MRAGQREAEARTLGLYGLYKEERSHEGKTRRMLTQLDATHADAQQSQLRLTELLLSLGVRDEMVRHRQAEETRVAEGVSAAALQEAARRRLLDEASALGPEAETALGDGFLRDFDALVRTDEATARNDIARDVAKYVDPHLVRARKDRMRRHQLPDTLESVVVAVEEVTQKRKQQLSERFQLRARLDHADRVRRVKAAEGILPRRVASVEPLLAVEPVEYRTDVGRREAEHHCLRTRVAELRAEEELLLQDRQRAREEAEAAESTLTAQADAACQRVVLLQKELETKESDLREMAAAQDGGGGAWASSTMELERDLAAAFEDEFRLRQEADTARAAADSGVVELASLEREAATAVEELAEGQSRFQEVTDTMESAVQSAKTKLLDLRQSERRMTADINDTAKRLLRRRDDVHGQTREQREAMNETIAHLALEDRMQSLLVARAQHLQAQEEQIAEQAEQQRAALDARVAQAQAELSAQSLRITQAAEHVTGLRANDKQPVDVAVPPQQLQLQLEELVKQWTAVEWEAASAVARVAARVDVNARDNERVLSELAKLVVLQEETAGDGVDIATATSEHLRETRDALVRELSGRAYREAKYTQAIRLLRDRHERQTRGGERQEPLTLHRHVPAAERRARREALRQTRHATDAAMTSAAAARRRDDASPVPLDHNTQARIENDGQALFTTAGASPSPAGAGGDPISFRRLVIDFIKKEIQPLYDRSELSRARFVDVVDRVSSWFLQSHKPALSLTEANVGDIVRNIQLVLSWQDDETERAL